MAFIGSGANFGSVATGHRLNVIRDRIASIAFGASAPNLLVFAVVRVFFNKNVSSCLTSAMVAGVGMMVAAEMDLRCWALTPQHLKSVTGCGRYADKKSMFWVVGRLLQNDIEDHHIANAAAPAIMGISACRRVR